MNFPDLDQSWDYNMSNVPSLPPDTPVPVWELAIAYPPQGTWTEDEYLELTDDVNQLIEFTHGQLEFLAMPTRMHQRIVKYLLFVLSAFVDEHELGEVLPGGIRVKTVSGKYRVPDVLFLSNDNDSEWGGDRFFSGADLAIEVVSPDDKSRSRDYDLKVADYAEGRIPEYWIVDPQEAKITVLTLPKDADAYVEHGVFKPGESATSKLLDGFGVAVQAVFDAAKN